MGGGERGFPSARRNFDDGGGEMAEGEREEVATSSVCGRFCAKKKTFVGHKSAARVWRRRSCESLGAADLATSCFPVGPKLKARSERSAHSSERTHPRCY